MKQTKLQFATVKRPRSPDAESLRWRVKTTFPQPSLLRIESLRAGDLSIDDSVMPQSSTVVQVKMAAFDLDGTLITTKGTNKFPRNEHDWRWLHPDVPAQLKILAETHTLLVLSNQLGLLGSDKRMHDFKHKIYSIFEKLQLSIVIYAALERDKYRKPACGMLEQASLDLGKSNSIIDMSQSFYIGDAAGRTSGWKFGVLADHSDSDHKFALNAGLHFKTPEVHFLNEVPHAVILFDPRALVGKERSESVDSDGFALERLEMIILVGLPASGKSTFCARHLGKYSRVNNDTLKSMDKCVKNTRSFLLTGNSVVIDNTNPDIESRARFISVARELRLPVRCFVMDADRELSLHNNCYRAETGKRDKLPARAFSTFLDRYQEPTIEEGLESITRIPFEPKFDSEQERQLYSRFYSK